MEQSHGDRRERVWKVFIVWEKAKMILEIPRRWPPPPWSMSSRGVIKSSERWRSEPALPLPAQFVQESSSLAALSGVKVRYRLISLHPINKLSGPANEFEKKGLKAITTEPDRPYKGFVTEGGERRFEALYADRAVSPVCVTCHNAHPQSSERDYRLNDVLGAASISIPVPG